MNLISIEYFLALKENGNFSATAAEMSISQSSLSKHIKSLENEYGVDLFTRNARNISLTDAGEQFAKHASKIVYEYYALSKAMQTYKERENNHLRIVSVPALHLYKLADMIAEFRKEKTDIKLSISEMPTPELINEMERQYADIAIVRKNIFLEHRDYLFFPLLDDELVILCNKEHPLALVKEVSLDELHDENFALLKNGVSEYENGLKKIGHIFNFAKTGILCQNPDTVLNFISHNTAISFMMQGMADYISKKTSMEIVKIKEKPKFPLAIAVHPDNLTELSSEFISYAEKFYSKKQEKKI